MGLNCKRDGGCKFPQQPCLASCSFSTSTPLPESAQTPVRIVSRADSILSELVAARNAVMPPMVAPWKHGSRREALTRFENAWKAAQAYVDGVPAVSPAADPQRKEGGA